MGSDKTVIGIDIGTTSTKSVVFGMNGSVRGSCSIHYPLLHERPSWAEQDPDAIVEAVTRSVKGAIEQSGISGVDVAGASLSSAMHSVIAIDETGKPLTRSMTWADGRSEAEAQHIRQHVPDIYFRTGTPIHPMSPLPKLIWLRNNRTDVWERAAKFVSIKEYVLFVLFGQWAVDYSLASATGLLNGQQLDWDEQALRLAGLETGRLSPLQPGTYRMQGLSADYAQRMGLGKETPFFLGGSDGAMANIGVGAIGPGEMAVTIGTSAAVRMMMDRPLTDERQRTFCYHVADSSYVIGGAANNGGIVLQWLREKMFAGGGFAGAGGSGAAGIEGRGSVEALLEEAAKVSPGAEGLLFLPFLTGERAPIWNAEARGTFFGANLGHGRGHFVRAGLEGVMLGVLSVAHALEDLAGPAVEVRASGGFTKSLLWRQMLADMLGQRVSIPRVTEASALGAAAIAMQELGELGHWSDIKSWIPIDEVLEPSAAAAKVYRELLGIYTRLCGALAPAFAEIADLQRKRSG
ncbi:gluconokinase [Paenibacillus oenotherae]|uniref:Gluconokinase n=1 Tax=Paenibacillus oenotherae TaxID=1435645 RepID=A0ABS7D847_9BACL|nr:gluconokinase [Paenibacillus oenotherae]MBW7475722.1 gluconokinase [Paenibacillus oenotherae]